MSLSKNKKNKSEDLESWANYEMEFIENRPMVENKDNHGFIGLQEGEIEKADFVPLEGYGNSQSRLDQEKDAIRNAREKESLLEQEGYEKGFAQGEKDGFELGEKKAVKLVENIEKMLDEISSIKQEILKRYEKEILDLIFAIAEKIVNHRISSDEAAVKAAIFNTLNLAVEKSKIILNVNPEDYDYAEKIRPELFKKYKELKSITVTSDPSISKGGCLLETPYGDVDAGIETQLEKIYQCLKDSFNEKGND